MKSKWMYKKIRYSDIEIEKLKKDGWQYVRYITTENGCFLEYKKLFFFDTIKEN